MDLVFHKDFVPLLEVDSHKLGVFVLQSDYTPNNMEVLKALIKAIKHDYDQIGIHSYDAWDNAFIPSQYQNLIIFGYTDQSFLSNVNIPLNKVVRFEKIHLLATFSITDMVLDPSKKVVLWKELQHMFLN